MKSQEQLNQEYSTLCAQLGSLYLQQYQLPDQINDLLGRLVLVQEEAKRLNAIKPKQEVKDAE